MERLSFGRGFVPRIGRDNHRALDPPGLFGDEPSEIPWVIVDGPWAKPDAPLLAHLHNLGVRVLVDSQPWRFVDEPTWEVVRSDRGAVRRHGRPGNARQYTKALRELAGLLELAREASVATEGMVPADVLSDLERLAARAPGRRARRRT